MSGVREGKARGSCREGFSSFQRCDLVEDKMKFRKSVFRKEGIRILIERFDWKESE